MPCLYLTEQDVDRLIDMAVAIDVMAEAFLALADGRAHNVPRVRAKAKGIVLHSMCAAADYLGLVGWKQYTTTSRGARFLVGLYDAGSGELVALLEANRLGQVRTGAVTGLAAQRLAPSGTRDVGLVGTGWQAQSQLAAVATALPIRRAFCYCRDRDKRSRFAGKMSRELGIDVTAVANPRNSVQDIPLVITATTSAEPVIQGAWLADQSLLCAIGSNWWHKAEIDVETIQRADAIVCDSVESCRQEAGDFSAAIEQEVFQWSQAIELADVVAEKQTPRASDAGIIVFKSVGMAIEDVALAAKLLEVARQRQIGRELTL